MSNKIKIIFFDWHKTLSNNVFFEHIEKPLYEEITNIIFTNDELCKDWMRGKITRYDVLKKISKNDKDFNLLNRELEYSCIKANFYSDKFKDIFRRIKKNNILLAIATDNMDVFTDITVKALNLKKYFDYILSSNELGYLKRDFVNGEPIFFKKILKKLNLNYEDCLFLDDQQAILDVYRDMGMNTEIVKNNNIEEIINNYI